MAKQSDQTVTWRPLALKDVDRISEWFWDFSDAALFDRSLPVPVSADTMRNSWRQSLEHTSTPCAYWFVAENDDNQPLGICGLEQVNYIQGDAILPFFVCEEFRKRGLAKVMAVSMLDFAFHRLRLHRVTTYYRSDNEASSKVLNRIGFTVEGRTREGWFSDGARKDIVSAGILGSEWAQQRANTISLLAESCGLTFKPTCWKTERGG